MMEHYYKLAKEAEKKMLPWFDRDGTVQARQFVEMILSSSGFNEGFQRLSLPTVAEQSCVFQQKPYLRNASRKLLIISHRKFMNEMNQLASAGDSIQLPKDKPTTSKLTQCFPKKMSQSKPITLNEMKPVSDTIYEDRVIELTIIEEHIIKLKWIQVIAEDNNGDVTRLFIHNVEVSKENLIKLGIGQKITIYNPIMQMGDQETDIGIRNDEPKCIVYQDQVHQLCRFCGGGNAAKKCSQCKKALYCSQKCQQHDWKILKHKLICFKV